MADDMSRKEIEKCQDLDVLMDVLAKRTFYGDRCAAVRALGNLGDERAIDPLIKAFNDRDSSVGRDAVKALGVIGAPAYDALVQVLDGEGTSLAARTYAIEALGMIGNPNCGESIIRVLQDEQIQIRRTAAFCLGRMKYRQSVDMLIDALKDEDFSVRDNAAFALQLIGDTKAIDPLIQSLNDKSPDVRCTAIRALGQIGDSRVVGPLTNARNDKFTFVSKCVDVAFSDLENRAINVDIGTTSHPPDEVISNDQSRRPPQKKSLMDRIRNMWK